MNLAEIQKTLEADVVVGSDLEHVDIEVICAADLMSDVLALARSGALLLTGLTNAQVIHTADVADLRAICIVRGKKPDEETVRAAESRNVPLLATNLTMFECCGRLYREGLPGVQIDSNNL